MGLRIIEGHEQGHDYITLALLYDSTTGVALPIEAFLTTKQAEQFMVDAAEQFSVDDIRRVPDHALRSFQAGWFKTEGERIE